MESTPLPRELTLRLDIAPEGVREARRSVLAHLDSWGCGGEVADNAVLVVSELLTNVYRHAEQRAVLRVGLAEGWLCVAVSDTVPRLPRVVPETVADEAGRGMWLVSALADRWESVLTGTGKEVRCWLKAAGAA